MPRSPARSFEDEAIQRALGEKVRALRHVRGWTQEQLVDRTGFDRSYLAEIERGRTNPTLRSLARLAQGLGVELADLFSLTSPDA